MKYKELEIFINNRQEVKEIIGDKKYRRGIYKHKHLVAQIFLLSWKMQVTNKKGDMKIC